MLINLHTGIHFIQKSRADYQATIVARALNKYPIFRDIPWRDLSTSIVLSQTCQCPGAVSLEQIPRVSLHQHDLFLAANFFPAW